MGTGPLNTGGGAGPVSSGEEVPGADLRAVCQYGKGGYEDNGVKSFWAGPGDTLWSNNHKVSPERFRWDVQKTLSLGGWCSRGTGHQKGGGIAGRGGCSGSGRQSHGSSLVSVTDVVLGRDHRRLC